MNACLPLLITFDGLARSGKGTIVHAVKRSLHNEKGYKVMLIDAGQIFRVLVVAAMRHGVDIEDPSAIDHFLQDERNIDASVRLVKDVYHMTKVERNALLYTNEVGRNSAKIGARPLSQIFKDSLLRKWMRDAHEESYEIVLLDGRALEETGEMLEREKLCVFTAHFYFVCDPQVGARRTLGFANTSYTLLSPEDAQSVDELVVQINERNEADQTRKIQPIVPPHGASTFQLPNVPPFLQTTSRPSAIIDTSGEMTIDEMTRPMSTYISEIIDSKLADY